MKTAKLLAYSKKGITAAALLLTINSFDAKAQDTSQTESQSIAVRLTKYEVKAAFQNVFRNAISNYISYSITVESNLLSEAYYEQDNPSVLWIIERWNTKTELDKISKSDQFKAISTLSEKALLQAPTRVYVKDLEPLSKQEWRRSANKDDNPITIMLFVDSKAGTESVFEKVYQKAMPAFRSEPGVINYQLSRFETDSTKFVTYEKFRNEAAFQYHLAFPPINPVIDYLNTSIKKQPFQDGLHRLIEFAPNGLKQ